MSEQSTTSVITFNQVDHRPSKPRPAWLTKIIDGRVVVERDWVRVDEDLPAVDVDTFDNPEAHIEAGRRTTWYPAWRIRQVSIETRGPDPF